MWLRWTLWVTAGEFVGFTVPAVAGALSAGFPAAATAGLLAVAGAAEGTLLGAAQARAFHDAGLLLNAGRWIAATAGAAMIAWCIGLIPMIAGDLLINLPIWVTAPVGGLLAVTLLACIGAAQYWSARTIVPRWWIATTGGAWLAGLLVFTAVTIPLWQPGQPSEVVAVIGGFGGLMMAATVAGLTGFAAVRLVTGQSTEATVGASSLAARDGSRGMLDGRPNERAGWPPRLGGRLAPPEPGSAGRCSG